MTPLLSVKNLGLRFGNNAAVNNVSFDLHKGEMLALVGESGSGKSLTALSCLGLQPQSARINGEIILDGHVILSEALAEPKDLMKIPRPATSAGLARDDIVRRVRGKTASMIFQEPMTALNPLHTIGKQIAEMGGQDAQALLDQVGLSHFKDRLNAYPHQLSGGERQRVMIAMAIAGNPALLIADEPTTAVDVSIQVKILALLKSLQQSRGMAMLFITHDLTIVRKIADRVAVMRYGEIVECGKVSEIFTRPAHPYTRELLASEPKGSPPSPPAQPKEIISCEQLKVYFPVKSGFLRRTTGFIKAVDDVSVTIAESSTLGVVGESGSGKSTLGLGLLRLVQSQGMIRYGGERIDQYSTASMRPLRKELQFVFQDPYSSLNPRMSIGQIIGEGLRLHFPQQTPSEQSEAIAAILHEVGLTAAMKDRYPHEFSGGQRQRISIARAMVLKPKLVVLDEPTSALDLTVQAQILELLKDLQKRYGLSYVFISHDLRVVRAIAHHIAVMKGGKIVEYGTTHSLLTSPEQDYTKTLIDAAML